MGSAGWWAILVLMVGALAWWMASRRSARRRLPRGLLRDQYEHCRRVLQLDSFEDDHILTPIVLMEEYRISGKRFAPADVIVDVGAHTGVFSCLCHLKGSRAIYAYEPGERNFGRLKSRLGAVPGIHCARAAVWRSDREAP